MPRYVIYFIHVRHIPSHVSHLSIIIISFSPMPITYTMRTYVSISHSIPMHSYTHIMHNIHHITYLFISFFTHIHMHYLLHLPFLSTRSIDIPFAIIYIFSFTYINLMPIHIYIRIYVHTLCHTLDILSKHIYIHIYIHLITYSHFIVFRTKYIYTSFHSYSYFIYIYI